jgi:hypothetical protein
MVTRAIAEAFVCYLIPHQPLRAVVMIGIFYLAVVVSRLVSSYRPRNRQQRHQAADQLVE